MYKYKYVNKHWYVVLYQTNIQNKMLPLIEWIIIGN